MTVDNYFKTKDMLEKKLQEELNRFRSINKYTDKLIFEQETPTPEPPAGDVPTPPADETVPAGDVPPAGEDVPTPPMDTPTDTPTDTPPADLTEPEGGDVEEMDITDLVNMTKSIKKDLENNVQDNSGVIAKMDDVFTKLDDLEMKISQMDNIISKIDELGSKIETMKPKTPEEKLEMRSLDSYPFNQNPQEFFADKQQQMKASGKNEYVLSKDDIQNYSNDEIKKSFNPDSIENEFKF